MTDHGSRLRDLIAEWRLKAKEANRLVARYDVGGDHAGNGHAFRKERRVWTTCADELDAFLRESPDDEQERLRIEVETLRTLLTAWQKRAYEAERTNPHGEPVDAALLEPFISEMQDRVIPEIVAAVQERQRQAAKTRDLPLGASASALSPKPAKPYGNINRSQGNIAVSLSPSSSLSATREPQPQEKGPFEPMYPTGYLCNKCGVVNPCFAHPASAVGDPPEGTRNLDSSTSRHRFIRVRNSSAIASVKRATNIDPRLTAPHQRGHQNHE